MEPVGESIGVDVCMIGLSVAVLLDKGWVSGTEIVLLKLPLDPCLVTGARFAGSLPGFLLVWLLLG